MVDVGGSEVRKGDVLTKTIAQDGYINMSLHPTRCNVGQPVELLQLTFLQFARRNLKRYVLTKMIDCKLTTAR